MFDTLDDNLGLREAYKGRFFLGVVTENVDPLNLDRVQVSVAGLYEPTSGSVPWCGPIKISPFGISKDWGVYGAPAIGSDVLILLQDGDAHYPMYLSIQRGAQPGFVSGTNWGFVDPFKNKLNVDLKTGAMKFVANAGVTFDISSEGALSVKAKSTATLTAPVFEFHGDVHTHGALTNNGVNVGSSHKHTGVISGGATTGGPT